MRLASTIELYSAVYSTPYQMALLVESWLLAADRDGMALRTPEYLVALRRAIAALRFSDTVADAIALLRSDESDSHKDRRNPPSQEHAGATTSPLRPRPRTEYPVEGK